MALPGRISWDLPAMSRRDDEALEVRFAHLFEEFAAPIYNYVLRMVVRSRIVPPISPRTRSSRPTASSIA